MKATSTALEHWILSSHDHTTSMIDNSGSPTSHQCNPQESSGRDDQASAGTRRRRPATWTTPTTVTVESKRRSLDHPRAVSSMTIPPPTTSSSLNPSFATTPKRGAESSATISFPMIASLESQDSSDLSSSSSSSLSLNQSDDERSVQEPFTNQVRTLRKLMKHPRRRLGFEYDESSSAPNDDDDSLGKEWKRLQDVQRQLQDELSRIQCHSNYYETWNDEDNKDQSEKVDPGASIQDQPRTTMYLEPRPASPLLYLPDQQSVDKHRASVMMMTDSSGLVQEPRQVPISSLPLRTYRPATQVVHPSKPISSYRPYQHQSIRNESPGQEPTPIQPRHRAANVIQEHQRYIPLPSRPVSPCLSYEHESISDDLVLTEDSPFPLEFRMSSPWPEPIATAALTRPAPKVVSPDQPLQQPKQQHLLVPTLSAGSICPTELHDICKSALQGLMPNKMIPRLQPRVVSDIHPTTPRPPGPVSLWKLIPENMTPRQGQQAINFITPVHNSVEVILAASTTMLDIKNDAKGEVSSETFTEECFRQSCAVPSLPGAAKVSPTIVPLSISSFQATSSSLSIKIDNERQVSSSLTMSDVGHPPSIKVVHGKDCECTVRSGSNEASLSPLTLSTSSVQSDLSTPSPSSSIGSAFIPEALPPKENLTQQMTRIQSVLASTTRNAQHIPAVEVYCSPKPFHPVSLSPSMATAQTCSYGFYRKPQSPQLWNREYPPSTVSVLGVIPSNDDHADPTMFFSSVWHDTVASSRRTMTNTTTITRGKSIGKMSQRSYCLIVLAATVVLLRLVQLGRAHFVMPLDESSMNQRRPRDPKEPNNNLRWSAKPVAIPTNDPGRSIIVSFITSVVEPGATLVLKKDGMGDRIIVSSPCSRSQPPSQLIRNLRGDAITVNGIGRSSSQRVHSFASPVTLVATLMERRPHIPNPSSIGNLPVATSAPAPVGTTDSPSRMDFQVSNIRRQIPFCRHGNGDACALERLPRWYMAISIITANRNTDPTYRSWHVRSQYLASLWKRCMGALRYVLRETVQWALPPPI